MYLRKEQVKAVSRQILSRKSLSEEKIRYEGGGRVMLLQILTTDKMILDGWMDEMGLTLNERRSGLLPSAWNSTCSLIRGELVSQF